MTQTIKTDIAIIGGGAGGLTVAAGAAQMGAAVVLIEQAKMGGDCLNYGCVPSKSLLAAAKTAFIVRNADRFGIEVDAPKINFANVIKHVHQVINTIAVNDSVERFQKLGVQVITAQGSFQNQNTIIAGDYVIKARRFVIATGSAPSIPPISGLETIHYYTNETIFNLTEQPEHLIVIGGGPIGCELAQAFLLLGSKVTVLEGLKILPRDEEDLVAILREELIANGLSLHEGIKVIAVAQKNNSVQITIEKAGQQQIITGSHLLIATGRRPKLDHLNLAAANIQHTTKGIQVDDYLRTTNKRIYAIGDAIGSYQFTHVANYHASIVLKNILFRLRSKIDNTAIPWVTYTHPELAHVGLSSNEALPQTAATKILTWNFAENDRAQTELQTLGKIKVITSTKGKILGVTILGAHAGELLLPWIDAIKNQKTVRSFTDVIVPYPTLSEISKRVAGSFYTPLLFSKRTRWIVRFLKLLG